MRRTVGYVALVAVLGGAGGCGYGPVKKILFGGISSIGDKDEEDPDEPEMPASGDAQAKPGAPVPLPAGAVACAEVDSGPLLVAGRVFDALDAPEAPCAAVDAACVASLSFAGAGGAVEVRYAGLAAVTVNAYRQCDAGVMVAFASGEAGEIEVRSFAVAPDGRALVQVDSGRRFARRD